MDATERLRADFFLGFFTYLFVAAALVALILLLIVFRKKIFFTQNGATSKVIFASVLAGVAMVTMFFAYMSVLHFFDLPAISRQEFEEFTAVVISQEHVQSDGLGSGMTVFEKKDGSTQTFKVAETKAGEVYRVVYLRYTKLAACEIVAEPTGDGDELFDYSISY